MHWAITTFRWLVTLLLFGGSGFAIARHLEDAGLAGRHGQVQVQVLRPPGQQETDTSCPQLRRRGMDGMMGPGRPPFDHVPSALTDVIGQRGRRAVAPDLRSAGFGDRSRIPCAFGAPLGAMP